MKQLKILIAPLDWGLGHASRCIPLIKALNERGHSIIIAGTGQSGMFLQNTFPENTYIEIHGKNITYGKGLFPWIKLILQIPSYLKAEKQEHFILQKIIKEYQPDFIISDNRYGLWSKDVFTILITHQLHPKSPIISTLFTPLLSKLSKQRIKKFDECWIPDFEEFPGLAGKLSHPPFPDIKTRYLGPLSRFQKSEIINKEKKYDFLAILSGPEPQRSMFESIIIEQCQKYSFRLFLLRGLPNETDLPGLLPGSIARNQCSDAELLNLMASSSIVISRSGYSSIMDMNALNIYPVMVPTPGQTEQEYLAHLLQFNNKAYIVKQKKINLKTIFESYSSIIPKDVIMNNCSLKDAIDVLESIKTEQ